MSNLARKFEGNSVVLKKNLNFGSICGAVTAAAPQIGVPLRVL
jgi:hypothetical protein